MTAEVWGMLVLGTAALLAGLALVRTRVQAAEGVDRVLVLGPVFVATSLAIFSAEHFVAARDLMQIVPKWLPGPLFWTYLVGVALLAAAVSFIAWRCVRWSATLLALLFFIIVATVDLPNISQGFHDRLFWTLTVRETCFASGAMVLAGSLWPRVSAAGRALMIVGRAIVAAVMIFYGIEHFFYPRNVPGVPLEMMTPAWMPAPVVIAYFVGIVLVVAGVGLFIPRTARIAAAGCGIVLLLLTVFFYGSILVADFHAIATHAHGADDADLAVLGINYVGDTLLFAATVLLAGFGAARE